MSIHWGDFVIEHGRRRGPLVVGIDPVATDAPRAIADDSSRSTWLGRYSDFVLTAVAPHVGFVKFQSAFFEAYGSGGIRELAQAIRRAKQLGLGVILDAKRGDIGSTAAAYARAYLTPRAHGGVSDLEVDCMTVNPFLGPDSIEPLLVCAQRYGKGLFVLAKTSNPGSTWLQDKIVDGESVSMLTAREIGKWVSTTIGETGWSAVGAVVGATYPREGRLLRAAMPRSILLVPGIGPQGGGTESISAFHGDGAPAVLVPVSRGITKIDDRSMSAETYGKLLVDRVSKLAGELS